MLVNVRDDRVKAENMKARPIVAVSVLDPVNPYRYLSVTGVVDSATDVGTVEHMDRLAERYLGVSKYPWARDGERRLMFRIRPMRVMTGHGDVKLPVSEEE